MTQGTIVERVIESMRSGLITAGLDGVIASTNRAAEEIMGRPKADLVGHPLEEHFGTLPMTVLDERSGDQRFAGHRRQQPGQADHALAVELVERRRPVRRIGSPGHQAASWKIRPAVWRSPARTRATP